jgi:death-on-curing protein
VADIQYLSLDDVIALHEEILERTGSPQSPLLRPRDLEAVLSRPRNAAWYEGADLVRQAVLLMVGISQCQAFLDGNKRTAFAAGRVFLRINGLFYQGDPMNIARWLEAVAEASREEREARTSQFEEWYRSNIEPLAVDPDNRP